jgi:C-terminal processing protease CtpA/Prc
MREFPNVTVLGDTTGGGLGTPIGAELPNGWAFRFSSSMTISPRGENLEDGIPPDITLYLQNSDVVKGHDTMIDKAISLINNN